MSQALSNADLQDLVALRRDLHAHPELGFQETRSAQKITEALSARGVSVHRGLGGTGLVAVIEGTRPGPMIGLRSDMDALPIVEAADVAWKSTQPGVFHGCGHDGHMTMLTGAGWLLAQDRNFAGSVALIFQPAEEGLGGARRMIADGLFEAFPCAEVYGLHNAPDRPFGTIALKAGAISAAADFFDIALQGQGGHAAFPYRAKDPGQAAVAIAQALYALIGTRVDPNEAAALAVTKISAGTTYNVIPDEAALSGTIRTFSAQVRAELAHHIHQLAAGIAAAYGLSATVTIRDVFSALINHEEQTRAVIAYGIEMLGEDKVDVNPPPVTTSEDFADMLMAVPGAYFFLGQGLGAALHNPNYAFNDDIIPLGAQLLSAIARRRLAALTAAPAS